MHESRTSPLPSSVPHEVEEVPVAVVVVVVAVLAVEVVVVVVVMFVGVRRTYWMVIAAV